MPKSTINILALLIISLICAGCTVTKDVKVNSYIEDRPRVDQELSGNSGYLAGTGSKQQPGKPTRKVFVVEVNKEGDPNAILEAKTSADALQQEDDASASTVKSSTAEMKDNQYPNINLPTFREEIPQTVEDIKTKATNEQTGYIDYVVEKDDTLQKLSKKFYNSYSKWPKIYEVNKAVIKNPDFIKPGITLRIPTEE